MKNTYVAAFENVAVMLYFFEGNTEELRNLQHVIQAAKAVVRYFKHSGLNASMQKNVVAGERNSLEQYVDDAGVGDLARRESQAVAL